MKRAVKVVSVAGALTLATAARADQFHYNNVPVGTRAVGMGGAFGGVADDASGIYYNPAGLAFALSNDIQGSANAFYKKKTTYKSTICGDDFVEDSSGSLTPFFGGLQKLDRYVEGMVFAFGVYYVDGDLKDQDTLIEDKNCSAEGPYIERYHRTSNARASTYYAGAAIGYRPMTNLAFGFGLNYFNADELLQEYQDARQTTKLKTTTGTIDGWRMYSSNLREHLVVHGVQPVLGVQAALPAGFTAGLTVKKGFIASQKFDITSESHTTSMLPEQKEELAEKKATRPAATSASIVEEKSNKPVGDWPTEIRLGTAWFASPTLLLAFDVSHYTAVKNAEKLDANRGLARYNREAVTNFHLGTEWYVAPSFPIRAGVFTNNDARPKVKKGTPDAAANKTCEYVDFNREYCGQPDHIDYVGESLFIAWVQPNSQIAAGVTLQQGKGQAQKLGDEKIQDVKSSQMSFAFSATHNL